MRRTEEGFYVEPCPFCGEETYFDGDRRYWPEGFPYIHCCVIAQTVPNEADFSRAAVRSKSRANSAIQPRIQAVKPRSDDGLPL